MITGNDLSKRNDKVKLADLIKKGKQFAFCKATQADDFKDKAFDSYWAEAKPLRGPNFKIGPYMFFDPRVGGKSQANFFLSKGFNFKLPGVLPPTIDVEDLVVFNADGTINKAATDAANKWVANNWQLCLIRLKECIETLKIASDKVIVYTYNNYMREYYHGAPLSDCLMWLSSLQPTCPKRYDTGQLPEFWQYSYRDGGSDLDGDYFTGTQEQLNALANITA